MSLCRKRFQETVYPKKLGESNPKDNYMLLTDMGPGAEESERYVLKVQDKEIKYGSEADAYKGWNEIFRSFLTKRSETTEELDYAPA